RGRRGRLIHSAHVAWDLVASEAQVLVDSCLPAGPRRMSRRMSRRIHAGKAFGYTFPAAGPPRPRRPRRPLDVGPDVVNLANPRPLSAAAHHRAGVQRARLRAAGRDAIAPNLAG